LDAINGPPWRDALDLLASWTATIEQSEAAPASDRP
jgi:hypothetical protein